ncbi:MAG: hypothetical protein U0Y68_19370 [Blastocatellia bacterium]
MPKAKAAVALGEARLNKTATAFMLGIHLQAEIVLRGRYACSKDLSR